MPLPRENEGFAVYPNCSGVKTATLAEMDARYSGSAPVLPSSNIAFDLTSLPANQVVTVGKTGSGADDEWSDLDAYPEAGLVQLNALLEFDGDNATTNIVARLLADTGNHFIGGLDFPLGPTNAAMVFECNGFAVMSNGVMSLFYSFSGVAANPQISLQTQYCLPT